MVIYIHISKRKSLFKIKTGNKTALAESLPFLRLLRESLQAAPSPFKASFPCNVVL